jgi:DNA-nicking Smr family endonuclease
MSGRRRGLSDEDRELWHGVIRSVSPLRRSRRKAEPDTEEEAPPAKPARKTKAPPNIAAAPAPKAKPTAAPSLAPLDRRTRQRIARGTHAIDARIDLHGYTQEKAHAALSRFLFRAQADGAKIALVITGKGTFGTGERGVLKRQVPMWLKLPEFRDVVVGFESAGAGHGGEGALYIRLRKRR